MKRWDRVIKKVGIFSFFLFFFFLCFHEIKAVTLHIVAAENMYGDIAKQIGRNNVHVDVILNNPDQDPHLFELTPRYSQIISQADLIIKNGLGYDQWIDSLIQHSALKNQKVISIQALSNRAEGSNPHLWYDLQSIKLLAENLQQQFSILIPEQKKFFLQNKDQLLTTIQEVNNRIIKIRSLYSHITVAATEPVIGLMLKNMGFTVLEESYQWVTMNGGEPTSQQIRNFITDLKTHKIQILFYNNQVNNSATENLKKIAQQNKIPVIGVEEMMPTSFTYQEWINHTLDRIETILQSITR